MFAPANGVTAANDPKGMSRRPAAAGPPLTEVERSPVRKRPLLLSPAPPGLQASSSTCFPVAGPEEKDRYWDSDEK